MSTVTDDLNVNVNFNVNGDRAAEGALRGIGTSASGIRGPIAGATGALTGLIGGLNPARVAAVAAGAAIAGIGASLMVAKGAVEAYVASNTNATAQVNTMRSSFQNLQITLGEAILSHGVLESATGAVADITSSLSQVVRQNSETFSSLARDGILFVIQATRGLIRIFDIGYQTFEIVRIGLGALRIATLGVATGMAQLGVAIAIGALEAIQQLTRGVQFLVEGMAAVAEATGQDGLAGSLRETTAGMQRFDADLQGMQAGLDQLSQDMSGALNDAVNEYGESVRQSGDRMIAMRDAANEADAALANVQGNVRNGTYITRSNTQAIVENNTARSTSMSSSLAATEATNSETEAYIKQTDALKSLSESTLSLADIKAVAEKGAAAGLIEGTEGGTKIDSTKNTLAGMRDNLRSMFDEFKNIGIEGGLSLADAFGTALGSGDFEEFKKNSGKIIGGMISNLGKTMVAAGVAISIGDPAAGFLPNPARGAALIGAGTAAIVLGATLGAAGGGKTKAAAAAPTAPGGNSQSTVINQTVQFGFVGDRRAAARDVAIETDRAARLGYT